MSNWPVKTLGEVCDFVRGVTFDKADSRTEMKSGFIPLLRATNITEKGLIREDFVFVPKSCVREDQKLMSGDALITIASGSASVVGRSVLVENPGDMTFGAFCGVLRPSSEILSRYLSHFMSSRSVRTAWSEAAQGTNINNLNRDDILQTECLLPPLEEQKRIVELLDAATVRVTELSACYEQARTHAKNLFIKTLDVVMFKDEASFAESTLKHLTTKIGSGATPTGGQEAYKTSGVPLIRSMNVHDSEFDLKGLAYIDAQQAQKLDGVTVDEGDVLLNITGASLTRTCLVPSDLVPARVNQHVSILRVKPNLINERYLQLFLVCARTKSLLWEIGGAAGSTRQALTKKDLEGLVITYPLALEAQNAIVEEADKLESHISEFAGLIDAKLAAAKNLRHSILEAAFAGHL